MKKNCNEAVKLTKFDYRMGIRLLISYCFNGVGIVLSVLTIVLFLLNEIREAIFLFCITIPFLLSGLILLLLPNSVKENLSIIMGVAVVKIKSCNSNDSIERYGTAIMIKRSILATNAKNILDDEGGVLEEINCYFLAKDCIHQTRRRAMVIKYDKELDIAFLGVIPEYRFPKEKYEAIKYRATATLKAAEEVYVIKNSEESFERIERGMVLFPLVEKQHGKRKDFVVQLNISTENKNSGGVIIDKRGRLIGMLQYDGGENVNSSYAVPIERILYALEY